MALRRGSGIRERGGEGHIYNAVQLSWLSYIAHTYVSLLYIFRKQSLCLPGFCIVVGFLSMQFYLVGTRSCELFLQGVGMKVLSR
jgi:hypothetical protein